MSERNAADRSGEPPQPATGEDRRALWRKLEKLRMAMVATHDVAGEMTARPLTTQQVEDDGTASFFVPLDGGVSEELARDARALVTYADVGDDFFVALRGRGEMVRDEAKARELWTPFAAGWFPGGPEDPNLGLLRVDVENGEYWDPVASKLVQFFAMAKAAVTRRPPQNIGEHRRFSN